MKEKIKAILLILTLVALWCTLPQKNTVMAYGECSEYGYMVYYESYTNTCKCMSGYVFGKDIFGNTSCVSADQLCRDKYGVMSRYDNLYGGCECYIGYVLGEDIIGRTQCISEDEWCRNKYGFNSRYNSLTDKCECSSGYEFSLKFGGGLECKSCFSKYGLHSSYDYLSKQCECNDGYTLDESNQCVEKQNNVYFLVEKLDLNNRKAIVKSDYDYREYLIKYGYGCYDFSFGRYVNNKIVINLGTDFDLDSWDKIVLQDDSETCDVISVSRTFGSNNICDYGYVLDNNRCVEEPQETIVYTIPEKSVTCPLNSSKVNGECFCNNGYTANNGFCITYTQSCQAKYGANSYGDKNSCTCTSGYSIYNNQCISSTEYCRLSYGDYALVRMINGISHCDCDSGYAWNSNITACIKIEVKPTMPPVAASPLPVVQKTDVLQKEVPQTNNPTVGQEKLVVESEPAEEDISTLANSVIETAPEKVAETTKEKPEQRFFTRIFESIKSFFSRIFKR
ncbi:MAG: hypothetical protein Q8N16_02470 [bacterium]|nr:hypothetical protein [bacterium]